MRKAKQSESFECLSLVSGHGLRVSGAYVVDDVSGARADGDEAVLRADDQAAAVLAPVAARDAPLVLARARRHLVARAPVVQDQRAWVTQTAGM